MVKGSKSDKEATYEFRDIVLAKVRGYPPWPGMVRSSSIAFRIAHLPIPFDLRLSTPSLSQKRCLESAPQTKSRPSIAYDSFLKVISKSHTTLLCAVL
jgi:hypothetical protein